jgi:asparagine synthase (glutamine-hydrolysing)
MCGIFGIVSNNQVELNKLSRVNKILAHRGPDDEGFLLFNIDSMEFQTASGDDSLLNSSCTHIEKIQSGFTSAFCHRRLSIIDLTASGHQPLSYDNGQLWIILNGEIYNYIEIRKELIRKGYVFQSTSDTEVVLGAYQEWGINCVERFNGMWAFAIWDRRKKAVFLSRDRLGVKPLYFCSHEGSFIFSSEIKGILLYLNTRPTLNELVFFKYALKGEVCIGEDNTTVFNEIKQLLPASNLVFHKNSIQITKYWKLFRRKNNFTLSENVERFRSLFESSISYRLRSDVEVGSCLSGGLDSSSIVTFASDRFRKRFHTFSAIWPGEKCDESFYIQKVNERYNCISTAFTPELHDFIPLLEKVVWHQEIPLPGPSILAQWSVMEQAKKHKIKVLLDGQGGDEILGGYPRYLTTFLREMAIRGKWGILFNLLQGKPETYSILGILKTIIRKNQFHRAFKIPLMRRFQERIYENEIRLDTRFNSLNKYLIHEIQTSSLPMLLHFEDRNSMGHGVEARVPFLDYRLVEFAISIPADQKMDGDMTKIILRKAMMDYLPSAVMNRKDKIGFETPIEELLLSINGKLYSQVWEYIESSELSRLGLLDFDKIKESNWKWVNFAVLSTAMFINKFFR